MYAKGIEVAHALHDVAPSALETEPFPRHHDGRGHHDQRVAGGSAAERRLDDARVPATVKMLSKSLTETYCTVRLDGLVPSKITVDPIAQRAKVELAVGGVRLSCP